MEVRSSNCWRFVQVLVKRHCPYRSNNLQQHKTIPIALAETDHPSWDHPESWPQLPWLDHNMPTYPHSSTFHARCWVLDPCTVHQYLLLVSRASMPVRHILNENNVNACNKNSFYPFNQPHLHQIRSCSFYALPLEPWNPIAISQERYQTAFQCTQPHFRMPYRIEIWLKS